MDIELETTLRAEYGDLLPDYVNVGNGWFHLIDSFCHSLRVINYTTLPEINKEPTRHKIVQIKEKFARLVIYVEPHDHAIFELTELISQISNHVCEDCGNAGKQVNVGYWLKTLCENCHQKRLDERASF